MGVGNLHSRRGGSTVELFGTAAADDALLGEEFGLDLSWHAPMHDLLRRAVAEGRGEQSVTALIELLRTGRHDQL